MEKGSFIKISYTGRVKDGKVFDTTNEEIAKKENIYDEKRVYHPLPIVVGEKQVIEGLEEAITGMKINESKRVEIPPEKAYGKRDPNLVRLVPMRIFKKQGINPVPGIPITLDGKLARIQTVAGGRVMVDFNHELAGKTLIFDIKIVDEAKTIEDKVKFLIERSFNNSENFEIKISEKSLEVTIPEIAYKDRNILPRKMSLSTDIFRYLDTENLVFREVWSRKGKD